MLEFVHLKQTVRPVRTMSSSVVLLLALLCFSTVLSDPNGVIVPCKKSDEVCMTRSANVALPIIAVGLPSLGVDGFEPARVPVIPGEASNFIFNFTRNEIAGYKDCIVSDVKLNLDAWKLKFDLTCPKLVLTGHLLVSGELLDVPVEGDEDYKLFLERYLIKVDVDIGKVEGADGHQHLKFKTFKHQGVPLGPSEFHYDSFKPTKALSPKAAAAFEENKYRKVIELASETYINTLYTEVMFKSVNKFLESVPFDELFID